MKTRTIALLFFVSILTSFAQEQTSIQSFAPTPPLGFNSYDSYRTNLNKTQAFSLVDVMSEKYLPFGYEYFVMDAGWYDAYVPEKHDALNLEKLGLLVVSTEYFPGGIKDLIKYTQNKGLKFGVWLMRGIPREAVKLDLPIAGTNYTARDIADTTDICAWSSMHYGVDMSKPGAQEYYNNLIDDVAEFGIDFIKVDDLVPNPEEIVAIANAIENGGHNIVFSLSPGDVHYPSHVQYYKRANMLRITRDIWDNPLSVEKGFYAWEKFQFVSAPGFWPDLDMIPFGRVDVVNENARQSKFDPNQMKSFIAQRALAASPLIIGGDLLSMDDYSYSLLTNKGMLECNQNGVMGVNVYRAGNLDVWLTPHKTDPNKGWIGIFNRTTTNRNIKLSKQELGFVRYVESYSLTEANESFLLKDIWTGEDLIVEEGLSIPIPAGGVAFYRFEKQ